MATETMSNLGANSAVIEYTGSIVVSTTAALMSQFFLAHGWEHIPDFTQGSTSGAETLRYAFRSRLLDGVNYKYMYFCFNTTYINIFTCQSMTGSGSILTTVNKNNIYALGYQSYNWAGPGKMYLFATNRFAAFILYGAAVNQYGSETGQGLCGVFEVEPANLADPLKTCCSVWVNTFLLKGYQAGPSYYGSVVSPPITRLYTGQNATTHTKIVTPIGEWGCKTTPAINQNEGMPMDVTMPKVTSWFNPGKHQIHEMTLVYDVAPYGNQYVKGRLCGLKTFTLGSGVNGDIFKVLCDSNHFLDPAGTLKDFYIVREGAVGSFGIPM